MNDLRWIKPLQVNFDALGNVWVQVEYKMVMWGQHGVELPLVEDLAELKECLFDVQVSLP